MSIKLKLGATGMAATALVASSCSIAEFDALMIVLKDLDYNNAEINNLLKGDSIDVAKYFVERKFERSQWKAVTASVGYKEELMKTYVPMVQKFDAASEESKKLDTLVNATVVQRTSVSDIIGLTNGLAEVGYDEKSLETVTNNPISLDSVRTIQNSELVPELIEGIVGSDNVKQDDIGGGKTLLDKYVEFADIVSDGRSKDFMNEGEFDVTTIANSVNLLNDLGMDDFEANGFEPSAAMAISEYLDNEYNAAKDTVWTEMDMTQAKYDRLSDSAKANIDKQVQEALDGKMEDLEGELVATTERLQRKTPTFVFTVRTLTEIQATFPAFVDVQQVFDAVGALPGDEVSSSDISVAVDLGDLASGAGVKIDALMEAFFDVTATFQEDGIETAVDVTAKIDTDYTVASDFDENNVGSYTIGYEVDENYNGDIEDLKNLGTHLGASKFAYVVISDVDPVFADPTNPGNPVSSEDFTNIDEDDFLIERDILDASGDYNPDNTIAASMKNIEIWYGATKIKFGAFELDSDAVAAEDIGTKLEIQFYGFDQLQNAWIRETSYDKIDDLEHLITKSGSYQIRIVFTNQSGEEYLVGGKGVEFTINTSDIAPPTIRFKETLTYNFNGTGGNVATVANALMYGFEGQTSADNAHVVLFDNISSFSEIKTGTYLLFDASYISGLSAGAKSICQEMGSYTHNGTIDEINISINGFNHDDMMCDATLMGSEFVEENLLMNAQDNFKVVVTAGDEAGNWGYGHTDINLTNTAGIGIDFIGGAGTQSNPLILDTYQSLYTTDVSRLREGLLDLANVSSNDLQWVEEIKNTNPELFNIAAGESKSYNDSIEYEYTVTDTHSNVNKGSVWVKFIDTTAPSIAVAPRVLGNTIAPTIKRGTDALAILNATIQDNDHSFISGGSSNITKDLVEKIEMKFVNSNGNADWITLTNDNSSSWSNIPTGNWSSLQAHNLTNYANALGKEMNISDHFALLEFKYTLKDDPSGNVSASKELIIPQVKVYDSSRPVIISYAGTTQAAYLNSNQVTLDQWNLPYSTGSNTIRNGLVSMDYDSSITGLKWSSIGGHHINTCYTAATYTPHVSFFWISNDLEWIDQTPDHDAAPINSAWNGNFWNQFNSKNVSTGSIGNIAYNLTSGVNGGGTSGNGSYLYQNYNGTGLDLIMVPTMNTGHNHYIQTDIRYDATQPHWAQYTSVGTTGDSLSILQKADVWEHTSGSCYTPSYWNGYSIT